MQLYDQAEKFIKDIFWTETHNKANKLHLPNIIAERLVKDNKEKDPDYYDHREGVLHATSLSKCLRGVVHEMLGTPEDPQDPKAVARKLGVFKAGNLFEEFVVDALGELMLDRQTEYIYKYNGIYLTGRDDGTLLYEGERSMLEAKSVHSDSFWYREQEGTLVAYQNQIQIQTYLWLRRILPNVFTVGDGNIIYTNLSLEEIVEYKGWQGKIISTGDKPDNSNLTGIFSYISKDDCTVIGAPVKFNQRIIDECVLPALDAVVAAYTAKDPKLVDVPPLAVYSDTKHQYQKNWLCTYCTYHSSCAGAGWVLEASNLVALKNKELKQAGGIFAHTVKAVKPTIEVVGKVEPTTPAEASPQ